MLDNNDLLLCLLFALVLPIVLLLEEENCEPKTWDPNKSIDTSSFVEIILVSLVNIIDTGCEINCWIKYWPQSVAPLSHAVKYNGLGLTNVK